jgi:hypothetical protein
MKIGNKNNSMSNFILKIPKSNEVEFIIFLIIRVYREIKYVLVIPIDFYCVRLCPTIIIIFTATVIVPIYLYIQIFTVSIFRRSDSIGLM